MFKIFSLFISVFVIPIGAVLQMQANFTTTINTICNGVDCNYSGPSILINEIMISPVVEDGSLFENGTGRQGEWIELYNPDVCQSVDISCYYLGNNAVDPSNYGAGIQIPAGTVIPPAGFCVIRGRNALPVPSANLVQNGGNVVEIIPTGQIVCMEGTRLWFPNAGGWFAFYNENGIPQDAVSWGNQANIGYVPCVANTATCNTGVTSLANYNNIPADRKQNIYGPFPDSWGKSMRRVPDGGNWVTNDGTLNYTLGSCNDVCAQVGTSSCNGEATVNITGGTPPYSYSWNDSQGQTTQTAVDLCAGTYSVIVTDNNGVTATFSVTIEDFVPDVSFSIVEDVCNEGQTIPFTNYSPQPTTGQTGIFSGVGVSGSAFDVSVSGDGQFPLTYTFTDEYDCTNSAQAIINVHETPTANISGLNQSYCISNDVIPINVSPSGGTLTGTGIVNNSFDIAAAGIGTHTISYTVTTDFGCSDSKQINVSVYENPTFTVSKLDSVCGQSNGEITLAASGGSMPYSYSIDNGNVFQNNGVFSNLSGGNYSLVVTDNNGCSATGFEHLTTFPFPDISAPNDIDVCVNESVTITAVNPDNDPISWDNGIQDGVEFIPTYIGSTTYTVTSTVNNCTTTDEVSVTVHDFPAVNAGGDREACRGDKVVLSGSGAHSYVWNNGVSNGIPFTPLITTTYEVIGTDIWGCTNSDEMVITVHPLPQPDFIGDTLVGCEPHLVRFTNLSNLVGIVSCKWDFGDGHTMTSCDSIAHTYTAGGKYDVALSITDTNGCTGKMNKNEYIEVISRPKANFWANPSVTGMSTPVINFTNLTSNGKYYLWLFGDSEETANTTHATFTYPDDKEGQYTVTLIAYNSLGCSDTTTQIIRIIEDLVFYIPNTFTPDNDEYNQSFQPVFTQGYNPKDFLMQIFNRWGELIFETRNAAVGWDGFYGNKVAPDGTYIWTVEFGLKNSPERRRYQGHINLIR